MPRTLVLARLVSACLVYSSSAFAAGTSIAKAAELNADNARDGVYDRFDGDLELGFALGAELGSAGSAAPVVRGTAHYFSIAGLYAGSRIAAGAASARSSFDLGIDVRPLFVPRWAKGYETGPALFDLSLDSLSLSLGAFWAEHEARVDTGTRGFEAELGFGVPLFASAAGPWLEARGILRYPDSGPREEALLLAFAWHAFVITPLVASRAE